MLKYGGGGHRKVGTCQFTNETMDTNIPLLLDDLVNYDKNFPDGEVNSEKNKPVGVVIRSNKD
jgi:hypothetical protein